MHIHIHDHRGVRRSSGRGRDAGARDGHRFTTKGKVLGLEPNTEYEVVGKEHHPGVSGRWGTPSSTYVKNLKTGEVSIIPTGNGQALGLLPIGDAGRKVGDTRWLVGLRKSGLPPHQLGVGGHVSSGDVPEVIVEANSEAEALAKAQRENPGYDAGKRFVIRLGSPNR